MARVSFEFFPPRTVEGADKLRGVRETLGRFGPEFFSVTFGAGGSTREGTFATVAATLAEGLPAAPHLSCLGVARAAMRETLAQYRELGVDRIVALRGDLPSGAGAFATADGPDEMRFARDLVAFIRDETGDRFHIEVAAYPETHPQARSPIEDLRNLAAKFDAGADSAITQYFYNADAYRRLVDDLLAAGVDRPIVPGIMPITNYTQLARFSDACGAEIPRWIRTKLAAYGDDVASLRAFGHDVVADLCRRLVDDCGAPSLHFYTMNQAGPTAALCSDLGLAPPLPLVPPA